MTARNPLVLVAGTVKELPAADTINGLGPLICGGMYLTTDQTYTAVSGVVLINLNASDITAHGVTYDTTNHRIVCITPGTYRVSCAVNYYTGSVAAGDDVQVRIYKNGSLAKFSEVPATSSLQGTAVLTAQLELVLNDYIDIRANAPHNCSIAGGQAFTFLNCELISGGAAGGAGPAGVNGNSISALNVYGAGDTLTLVDNLCVVEIDAASSTTFTIPPQSSFAFPALFTCTVVQKGAGQVTLTAGAGVTIRSNGSRFKTNGQWAACTLYRRASNEWVLAGDLVT